MGRGMGWGRMRHAEEGGTRNPLASIKRVLPWVAPYWPVMLFGLACMLVTTFLNQQPPRVTAYLLDTVLGEKQFRFIPHVVLLFLGIYAGQNLFGFLRTYWLHVAGQQLLHQLRVRLYGHFQRLPLTYYDNRQTGDLMSRMTGDVEQIENIMVHGLDVLVMGVLGMALAFYYMWGYQWQLTLLLLIPVPVIAVSIFFFGRAVRRVYRSIRDRIGDLNARLQDNISGIRVIKAFCREETELTHVTAESENVWHMNVRGIRMWSSFGPAMSMLGNVGALTVLGVGAVMVARAQLTPGQLIAFTMYVGAFYGPIGSLFQFYDSIQRSLAAADRIFEVLDTVPAIQDPDPPQAFGSVRGQVEFRDVSFRYATGEEVLRHVNVTAQPGQRIAIVGRSGAGKTSFINLIPRFYDVLDGAVLVDEVDVRRVCQADLRRHIALVLQETFLFNGSVRENLRFGRLGATDEELTAAAQIANAHEFIERLLQGYDTEIGERGVKLSGGQRQRLAIARAVLADPRILILDEATSSIDSESEFLIHQALERLMAGRTTFIIAHRLSTIKSADLILVLEDGEIVERGTHGTLLRRDGPYARMYRQQFWLDDLFREDDEEDSPAGEKEDPDETMPVDLDTLR